MGGLGKGDGEGGGNAADCVKRGEVEEGGGGGDVEKRYFGLGLQEQGGVGDKHGFGGGGSARSEEDVRRWVRGRLRADDRQRRGN